MRSINTRSDTHLALRFIYVWVAATLVALLSAPAVAPSAFAADETFNKNDVSGVLEGTLDEEEGAPDSEAVSDAIADGLTNIADKGRATDEDQFLLEGIGNALRQNDSKAVADIFDKVGTDRIKEMVENDSLMQSINNFSPQAYDWFDQFGRNVADRYGFSHGTTQDIIDDVISMSTFGGSNLSMQGGHTYADLLASVIFSLSTDQKNAAANQLEMSTLKMYPSDIDQTQTYGQLLPPEGNGFNSMGERLAAFIEGIFQYEWIVPADENNQAQQVGSVSSLAMKFGSWGAAVYDAVTGVIRFSSEAFSNLNIVNMFGLGSGGQAGEENLITRFVASTLENMGISSSLTAIRVTAATVIGIAFLYIAMSTISSARIGQVYNTTGARRLKGMSTRLLVIVIAVPFAVIFTSTIDTMTRDFTKNQFGSAAGVNNQYVVDTLAWAAGSNLAMGNMGSASVDAFSPERQSVSTIMNTAQRNLNAASINNDSLNSTKAADLMSAYSSGETASVDDYFAMIASASGTSIAASNSPIRLSRGAQIHNGHFKELSSNYFTPYFLSMRGDSLDSETVASSDSSSSSNEDETAGDAANADGADEPNEAAASNSQGDDGNVRGSITFSGSQNGERFECGNGKMICQRVMWNRPSTYIYGAAAGRGASAEQSSIANYIASAGTHQNFDPATGEEARSAEKQRILNANATNIALANRYSGMDSAISPKSLSTQSVAILLQSSFDNGALNYRALNASATAAGSTVYGAHGRGTSFQRYVIPNTGTADLSVRVGSLVAMWMTAPIIAIVALFALFRAPILLAIVNMFKGFFQGLVMGNIGGLFKYALYYMALRMSFVFATAAIVAGIQFADMINNILPTSDVVGASGSLIERRSTDNGGPLGGVKDSVNEVWNSLGGLVNSAAQGIVLIVLTLVLCFVVVAPLFTMNTSNRGPHKVSLVTLIVTLPYILADVASSWIDGLVRNMFGMSSTQSKSVTGASKDNIGFEARNPKDLGRDALETTKDGVGIAKAGAGIATGGMGAAAGFLAGKAANALAQTPAEEGLEAASEKLRVGAKPDGEDDEFLTDENGVAVKDENGNPIPIDSETGQPLEGEVRDENGNPIDPETGQPVDPETGQPVDPETGQPIGDEVRLDEDGNPIDARVDGEDVELDEDGNPIEVEGEGVKLDEDGNPIEVEGEVDTDGDVDEAAAAAAGAAAANALNNEKSETDSIDADNVDADSVDADSVDADSTEADEIRAGNADVGEQDVDEERAGEQEVDEVHSDEQDVDEARSGNTDVGEQEVNEERAGEQEVDEARAGNTDVDEQDVNEERAGKQEIDETRAGEQDVDGEQNVDQARIGTQDNQSAEVRDQSVDGQNVDDADAAKQEVNETHNEHEETHTQVVENADESDRALPSDREGEIDGSAVAAMGGAAAAAAASRSGGERVQVDKLDARANSASVDSNDAKISGNVDAEGDVESKGDADAKGDVDAKGGIESKGKVSSKGDVESKGKTSVAERLKSGGYGRERVRATIDGAKQAFSDPRATAEAAARKVSEANANKSMMNRQDASRIARAVGGAVAGNGSSGSRDIRSAMRDAAERMHGREVRVTQTGSAPAPRASQPNKPDQSTVDALTEALKRSGVGGNAGGGGDSYDSHMAQRQIDEMRELNQNLRNARRN